MGVTAAANLGRYVDFAMHRVKMVKHFGVTPYMVFDGDFLPSKASTEESRASRREEGRKAGLELLRAGKPAQAYNELQKAIDVTPEMARHLIEELKTLGIPYVVAPYEADAQLVYLERQGIISGIISEDSDLLVFGAKRLLTKLDRYGNAVEINRRDFCAVREVSLTGWSDTEFRHMAILNGCDYLAGVGNMGLKTAHRMIRKHKTPEKVIRMLQFDGKYQIPEGYLASFKQAELTFLHQRVFCPNKRELVMLTEPNSPEDSEQMPFIGGAVETELARSIAVGDVNPITKEPIVLSVLPGKRRNSQVAAPATTQTQKGRPGVPIDAYFKGHRRIPLGEMDPNCFVVQPGQARNLPQGSPVPQVFPLPRPYIEGAESAPRPAARPYTATAARIHRRRTEPVSRLLGMDDANTSLQHRRRTEGPTAQTTTGPGHQIGSATRPSKKARLCEDLPTLPDLNQGSERSKFFPSKPTKAGRKSEPAVNIFSDDSINEALLSLPDVGEWHAPRSSRNSGKLEIFEDVSGQVLGTAAAAAGTGGEEVDANSKVEVPRSSPLIEPLEASSSETPVIPSFHQFSYTPAESQPHVPGATRVVHGLPTPASSMQKPASQSRSSQASQTPFRTPLQRLGSQAFQRGGKGSFTPPALSPRGSSTKSGDRRRSYASLPVNPSFVPLPKVDLAEVEALNTACGSEDQIIPDSDGENDQDADADHANGDDKAARGSTPMSRLNLSRFLYA